LNTELLSSSTTGENKEDAFEVFLLEDFCGKCWENTEIVHPQIVLQQRVKNQNHALVLQFLDDII